MSQLQSNQASINQKPEIAPEISKITSELATQAALRAKEMLSNKAAEMSKKVPEIPARANPDSHKVPPEIPPKRFSLKKAVSEQTGSPSMNRTPPPLPQKPVSVQNSPQLAHKFKEKPLPNVPQQPLQPRPKVPPTIVNKLPEKATPATVPSLVPGQPQHPPPPTPQSSFQQSVPKNTNSPQLLARSVNSPLINARSQPQSIANSPQLPLKKPTPKAISPSEDFGSEDALRGIESGLRNMERAMQEQMNLRSLEAANATQSDNLKFDFKAEFKSGNIRSVGSITSLDGSSQNLKRMGAMEPQIYRGLERNLSMDQMRLDSFTGGNVMRSMESNPNIRSALDEIKLRSQNQQEHSGYPREHHMRSLDRNLPLELQYSRHRAQDYPASVLAGDFIEQIRYQLATGGNVNAVTAGGPNSSTGGNAAFMPVPAPGLMQQQQQRVASGISREDLRMRRRSSHDETQFSQGGIPVTRLREHWDETSQCVLQRASQLKNMLGDSQRYESKRLEMETWLSRMENKCERMGTVATTADVLEAQQKEQKSFHAELHQYKHQIELFNGLTQKLIAVYPGDDTSRIKRMTESVNQRYNNLNNAVINRGKLLHAAVHNLQSFDRSMDQFLAWLSEAESLCENAESEIDRNPLVLKVGGCVDLKIEYYSIICLRCAKAFGKV